jgi:hypothetical protein
MGAAPVTCRRPAASQAAWDVHAVHVRACHARVSKVGQLAALGQLARAKTVKGHKLISQSVAQR